ncbi:hypothetical protein Tcur_2651 [Thermomonospora curvata DSM 43183]|uniref:Uncharacterized protein n=1 Tax=Thermomonospora curvata (strain ATCC 19995 / DSM 43183 / JCM 3096 / KCTC 9072 / NBRC 15933 / NCIMB 10081 / Henssen B9) TaxID=471852 RepID=D1A5Q8_THECD|nr:hypothetical protein Tcur_2651 [Thermomonospora curvata DSM 43183]PKK14002.1 MAG: hypothetical protein BUE48_012960 [Thermomonospora sp. CIF 1]
MLLAFVVMLATWFVTAVCRSGRRQDGGGGHPESMTKVLEPEDEEYLAWLADRHWPADEYLDLERQWRAELAIEGMPDPHPCPGCRRREEDVWPCRMCGLLLHAGCGHGMRKRRVVRPYRTRDMQAEAVIAEWICVNCSSVVALDLDQEPEED